MKIQPYLTASLFLLLCFSKTAAQRNLERLEINPYIRMDWYPEFTSDFGGTANTDHITIKGNSPGLNVSYKIPLRKNINIKAGIGYYLYSFTKIKNINSLFGEGDGRRIFYPSPNYLQFGTNGYKYHTLSINTSVEKIKTIDKKTSIVAGIAITNYFTLSQLYNLPGNYPIVPKKGNYKTNTRRYFGYSGSIYFSLLKSIGNAKIGPSVIIPIYDRWGQDDRFNEENSDGRNKWFRGIGLGVVYCFH